MCMDLKKIVRWASEDRDATVDLYEVLKISMSSSFRIPNFETSVLQLNYVEL